MRLSGKSKQWLAKHYKSRVRFDEPMHRHTYFSIGGPADAWVSPESLTALVALVEWCRENQIPFRVLGNGSNVLVRDGGIRGVVIDLSACENRIAEGESADEYILVNAGAGAPLGRLCRFALGRGLAGMNFALGIPGSVGGAVKMNAGTAEGAMGDVIHSVRVLLSRGGVICLDRAALLFSYRRMAVKKDVLPVAGGPPIILGAAFSLCPADPGELKRESERLADQRRNMQPVDEKSAGCFFKNPAIGAGAGRLIDESGLKGCRIGGAGVSLRHANFIINHGNATAKDVIALMHHIQERVVEKFNVSLEAEVEIIGDELI